MPEYRGTLATWLDYLIGKLCLSPAFDPTADHTSGLANNWIVVFCFPSCWEALRGTSGLFVVKFEGKGPRPKGEFTRPMIGGGEFSESIVFRMSPWNAEVPRQTPSGEDATGRSGRKMRIANSVWNAMIELFQAWRKLSKKTHRNGKMWLDQFSNQLNLRNKPEERGIIREFQKFI